MWKFQIESIAPYHISSNKCRDSNEHRPLNYRFTIRLKLAPQSEKHLPLLDAAPQNNAHKKCNNNFTVTKLNCI